MRSRIRSALLPITVVMLLGSGTALAASNACKADLNGNGVVNFADLAIMKQVFFQSCPGPTCGDGSVQAPEQCDDSNLVSGDGCSKACRIEVPPPVVCGNGIAQGPIEQCDDGNLVSGDGCSATCTIEPLEQGIRAFYATLKARVEAHDGDGVLALFTPDYLDHGRDLSYVTGELSVLSTLLTFDFAITRIIISDGTAQVYGTLSVTFNDGKPSDYTTEPGPIGNSPSFGWLKLTASGWRLHGDQARAGVELQTRHNTSPGGDHYFFNVETGSLQEITSVTFSGSGIPDTALARDPNDGEYGAIVDLSDPPVVGTGYSFSIDFADHTQLVLHDTVKSWVPMGPSVTVTPGPGTATVSWTDVSPSVPSPRWYRVQVWGDGGVSWGEKYLPLTRTSAVFNEDGTAVGVLESGQSYAAEVRIYDQYNDYAYQTFNFTMP